MQARVDDLERRARVHHVLAEGVRERRLAHVADAHRALEHLALGGDQGEQRDRHVQDLGDEPRDAVEGRLGRRVHEPALARAASRRGSEPVGHGSSATTIDATSAVRRARSPSSSRASNAVTSTPTTLAFAARLASTSAAPRR